MKPNERMGAPRWAWIIWGLVVIASLIVAPHLPARIATHFGANGKPNGYSNRWAGVLLMPGLMVLLLALWQILWRIDPKRHNYATMAPTYRYVGGLVIGFLADWAAGRTPGCPLGQRVAALEGELVARHPYSVDAL